MRRVGTASLVLALITLAGCATITTWRYKTHIARMNNKPAPNFVLTDLDGAGVQLSELRGKAVVLAFWAHG